MRLRRLQLETLSQVATDRTWPNHDRPSGVDAWHILVVTWVGEDLDADHCAALFHPEGCPVRLDSRYPAVEYTCPTAMEIRENGYYGLFHRHDTELKPGVWLIAPWVERIQTPDGEEFDGGWHCEPLAYCGEAASA